jgi:hypothetical protein
MHGLRIAAIIRVSQREHIVRLRPTGPDRQRRNLGFVDHRCQRQHLCAENGAGQKLHLFLGDQTPCFSGRPRRLAGIVRQHQLDPGAALALDAAFGIDLLDDVFESRLTFLRIGGKTAAHRIDHADADRRLGSACATNERRGDRPRQNGRGTKSKRAAGHGHVISSDAQRR